MKRDRQVLTSEVQKTIVTNFLKGQPSPNVLSQKIPVLAELCSDLSPIYCESFTKQGGQIKTWRKFIFVVYYPNVYYFKKGENSPSGVIELDGECLVRVEHNCGGAKHATGLVVITQLRVWYIISSPSNDPILERLRMCIEGMIASLKGRTGMRSDIIFLYYLYLRVRKMFLLVKQVFPEDLVDLVPYFRTIFLDCYGGVFLAQAKRFVAANFDASSLRRVPSDFQFPRKMGAWASAFISD